MKKITSYLSIVTVIFFTSCSTDNKVNKSKSQTQPPKILENMHIYGVTDFEYTMNGKQAVSITFGVTEKNNCSATIHRKSVKKGYSIEMKNKNSGDLSIECNWDGKYYVQSSKHPTLTRLKIKSIDPKLKEAEVVVSVNVVEPISNKYLDIGTNTIKVSGQNFDNLVKKM